MIREVKLKTVGMFDEEDQADADFKMWQELAEYMDGEEALVADSVMEKGSYVFIGLKDERKNKELFYMMEQDRMTGIYINDRTGFDEIWDAREYIHEGSFILKKEYLQF